MEVPNVKGITKKQMFSKLTKNLNNYLFQLMSQQELIPIRKINQKMRIMIDSFPTFKCYIVLLRKFRTEESYNCTRKCMTKKKSEYRKRVGILNISDYEFEQALEQFIHYDIGSKPYFDFSYQMTDEIIDLASLYLRSALCQKTQIGFYVQQDPKHIGEIIDRLPTFPTINLLKILSAKVLPTNFMNINLVSRITTLIFSSCDLNNESARLIFDAISNSSSLRILNIYNSRLGDNQESFLSVALKMNKSIQNLEIMKTLDDMECNILQALESHSEIKELSLQGNDSIGDQKIIKSLCSLLNQNKLKTLKIKENGDVEDWLPLIRCINNCWQLNVLSLDMDSFDDEIKKEVEIMLRENQTINEFGVLQEMSELGQETEIEKILTMKSIKIIT
jgi:hypothetical protein